MLWRPVAWQAHYKPENAQRDEEDIKRDIAEQARIEPFLKGQYEDFNMAKKLRSKAEGMLKILKEHKKEWPGFVTGKFPESFHRNPAVRKYIADANTVVTLLANSRKGQPTNAKLRFDHENHPAKRRSRRKKYKLRVENNSKMKSNDYV